MNQATDHPQKGAFKKIYNTILYNFLMGLRLKSHLENHQDWYQGLEDGEKFTEVF